METAEKEDSKDRRHFFAVHSDVAESFAQIAAQKNMTLYGALTDILREAVQLELQGNSITDASSAMRQIKTAREAGYVMVPENLWYELVESKSKADRNGTIREFREAGSWIGRYVLAKSHTADIALSLRESLAPLTFDCTDFNIEGTDKLRITCFNPSHSQIYTELFSTLLVAIVESLGYSVSERVSSRGAIILGFEKRKEALAKVRGR